MRTIGLVCLLMVSCSGSYKRQHGDSDKVILSESQEYYVGRSNCAKIFTKYKLLSHDNPLTTYVNQIGFSIALKSNRPTTFKGYHFGVIDTEEVNALAFASGFIFVTTGILKHTKSEDEIAAILAHEIAHINLHHPENAAVVAIEQVEHAEALENILKGIVGIGKLLKVKSFEKLDEKDWKRLFKYFDKTVNFCTDQAIKGYGRDQELEADILAMQLLARANYNPFAIRNFLKRLNDIVPNPKFKDMLKGTDHPTPKERTANLDTFIKKCKENPKEQPFDTVTTVRDENPRMGRFLEKTKSLR